MCSREFFQRNCNWSWNRHWSGVAIRNRYYCSHRLCDVRRCLSECCRGTRLLFSYKYSKRLNELRSHQVTRTSYGNNNCTFLEYAFGYFPINCAKTKCPFKLEHTENCHFKELLRMILIYIDAVFTNSDAWGRCCLICSPIYASPWNELEGLIGVDWWLAHFGHVLEWIVKYIPRYHYSPWEFANSHMSQIIWKFCRCRGYARLLSLPSCGNRVDDICRNLSSMRQYCLIIQCSSGC